MKSVQTLLVLSTTFVLLACGAMGGSTPLGNEGTVTEATVKQLAGDVPLPQSAVLKQQDTLVMGSGNHWTGRLSLTVAGDPQTVFAYFRDNLPASGWTLTSSSFSKLSLLTFTKGERVATVQLQGGSFGSNEVLITVAPAVRAAAPGRP